MTRRIDLPITWAQHHIRKLMKGRTVRFTARGNSMVPRLHFGQFCTVAPIGDPSSLQVDEIVLCTVEGASYLNKVAAIRGDLFQIGNNHGDTYGWIKATHIHGRVIDIEPLKTPPP